MLSDVLSLTYTPRTLRFFQNERSVSFLANVMVLCELVRIVADTNWGVFGDIYENSHHDRWLFIFVSSYIPVVYDNGQGGN